MKAFLITVDTEPDDQWNAERRRDPTLHNLSALVRFQQLLDRYGAKPTYLITYSVAKHEEASALLKEFLKTGRCEVGAHLHPWETPPGPIGRDATYPHRLPAELERNKLLSLTRAIQERFSVSPRSYRAGRYGLGERSIALLQEFGYQVDTSITPWVSWHRDGGRDFLHETPHPYFLGDVLEIPVSIAPSFSLPSWQEACLRRLLRVSRIEGALQRIGLKILWLRPSTFTLDEMKRLSDLLIERNAPALTMMLHSSELYPGTSPHQRTEKETDACFGRIEGILEYLVNQKGLRPMTLAEFRREWEGAVGKEPPSR